MMKRSVALIFAVLLMTLLAVNSSAMVYDDFGDDSYIVPALDCSYTFDLGDNGELIMQSPVLSELSSSSVYSDVFGQSDEVADFLYFQTDYYNNRASYRVDVSESGVGSNSVDISSITLDYEPFTINRDELIKTTTDGNKLPKYDGLPLFETIGANINWLGNTATVDVYVEFDLHYVGRSYLDSYYGIWEYQTYSQTYGITVHMDNVQDGFGAPDIPISAISIIDVASGQPFQTITAFLMDFNGKNSNVLQYYGASGKQARYVDVHTLTIDVVFGNAVTTLGFDEVPYYDQGYYANINSSAYYFKNNVPQFRQQLYSSYLAHNAAVNLNKQEISSALLAGESGSNNPLVKVPALFLSAVGDFFAIDFFGMGFTLGHLTFVIALCSVVLIFLKMFAGG